MTRARHLLYVGAAFLAAANIGTAYSATIQHRYSPEAKSEIILISGDIASGDDAAFKRLAIQYDNAVVALDSPGGLLSPALEIGRIIRIKGFSTLVGNSQLCASSCALIWLAGSHRYMAGDGQVGFHASYISDHGVLLETGVGNALIGHYLSQLNLSQKAVIFTTMAPPEDIVWLTPQMQSVSGIDFEMLGGSPKPASVPNLSAGATPEDRYLHAYDLYKAERYDEARREFLGFLDNYPNSERVTFVQHWLGKMLLDKGAPLEAAKWFVKNYQSDHNAAKAPDSLLALAQAMEQLRDHARACVAFHEFENAYPAMAAGRLQYEYNAAKATLRCAPAR